ncbi:MAG: bifunctional aconitate hydratase 2/2-methylisocitrate dehydratase [Nitrosomonadales bacterium]
MIEKYKKHIEDRSQIKLPPLPLTAEQTAELIDLIKVDKDPNLQTDLIFILKERVPAGVDQAAYVKAAFLNDLATEKLHHPIITPQKSIEILGTMLGGYNVQSLVPLLNSKYADDAVAALSKIILMFDAFHDVYEMHKSGNRFATKLLESWANADWFTSRAPLGEAIKLTVFKVDGETNTDDLSPAQDAWSRADIPLHAQAMLVNRRPGSLDEINILKDKGNPLVYVGDVVGTGSSRKSAINSLQWHMGKPIPFVPNKHSGGFVIGGKIAPIFFNTAEDSGSFPIECDVTNLSMGDEIILKPFEKKITNIQGGELVNFSLNPITILDEVRAGGRIPLIIGRELTDKSSKALNQERKNVFVSIANKTGKNKKAGFSLAQKMVGRACGVEGILPGTYCEPKITSVGSQDTTGAMTRDELKELACLGFSADLVMQSFCHTAAYPKPVDINLQHTLPDFMSSRGGVSLKAGDGVIHSWLNRMILPDTVGTGGDSHTRFPIGISFPAGSGLVAFAAALGVMPLDMPESVLVRFKGNMQPGITLRDLVNAIPFQAIKNGDLTIDKKGKKNIFNGRILEIEGLPELKVEQAFELADASAERSANGCTVRLNKEPIIEYLNSNIVLMENMITQGYEDKRTLQRRIDSMKSWISKPELLQPDENAEYAAVIDIDLNDIKEPLIACPNDPDNIKTLSEVHGDKINEVFIGSCMTNIGHYRAAGKILDKQGPLSTRLWIAPPTRMDESQLRKEGYYSIFGQAGARTEIPGCSLCMGNQARVEDNAHVFSTSTRNFDNRMGKGAQVYLGSAELAAVCALLGKIPTLDEYLSIVSDKVSLHSENIYQYLNFHLMEDYKSKDKVISIQSV